MLTLNQLGTQNTSTIYVTSHKKIIAYDMFKRPNVWQVNVLEAKCLKQNSQTGEDEGNFWIDEEEWREWFRLLGYTITSNMVWHEIYHDKHIVCIFFLIS